MPQGEPAQFPSSLRDVEDGEEQGLTASSSPFSKPADVRGAFKAWLPARQGSAGGLQRTRVRGTIPDRMRALLEEIRKTERRNDNPDAELIKTILSRDLSLTRKTTRLKRDDPLELLEALYVVERWLGKSMSFMEFMDKLRLS
jgi:hypothetical protein